MRTCSKCQRTKPVEDFYALRRRGYEGLQRWCKECMQESARQWKLENPDAVKAADRRKVLKRRYGITQRQYDELLRAQDFACAVCGRPERTIQRKGSPIQFLAVDHDHETATIRGLLCQACNRHLGNMGDNLEGVMRFVRYLERSACAPHAE